MEKRLTLVDPYFLYHLNQKKICNTTPIVFGKSIHAVYKQSI